VRSTQPDPCSLQSSEDATRTALLEELVATLRLARELGDAALAREVLAELRALRQAAERDELAGDVLERATKGGAP
jgi:hypothetical protein